MAVCLCHFDTENMHILYRARIQSACDRLFIFIIILSFAFYAAPYGFHSRFRSTLILNILLSSVVGIVFLKQVNYWHIEIPARCLCETIYIGHFDISNVPIKCQKRSRIVLVMHSFMHVNFVCFQFFFILRFKFSCFFFLNLKHLFRHPAFECFYAIFG